MGHIVNPISYRLKLNRTWNSSWSSNNFINYSYLIQRDLFVYNFLKTFFLQSFFLTKGLLYSHSRIISLPNGRFTIINYIYNDVLFRCFNRMIPYIYKYSLSLVYQLFKGNNLVMFKKYNNLNSGLKNDYLVSIFLDKLYKFMIFYFIKFIYLKPINYTLKILNIILLRWLVMISPKFLKYDISYNFLEANQITSQVIALYLTTKLKQRHMLFKVIKPVFKNLEENPLILGYKICCSGRFTRKQRATYYWVKKGLIPFNRINSVVDYAYKSQVLPFGACGVKVWLCRKINFSE